MHAINYKQTGGSFNSTVRVLPIFELVPLADGRVKAIDERPVWWSGVVYKDMEFATVADAIKMLGFASDKRTIMG